MMDKQYLLDKQSFIELDARSKITALLDRGEGRELVSPFDEFISPWLEQQDIVPQFDDGVVVVKGKINSKPAVVVAIEGGVQGGSLGEVGGAKLAAALELAISDNLKGIETAAVLILETGGVRLQEANLGLAAIAEIHAAIVNLKQYSSVVAVIAGSVGCFGGMSIAAGLCSQIIMTREGRLGLNGPQVIEQEAGVEEYDASDRPFIWSICGGKQRFDSGLVDAYVPDDSMVIKQKVIESLSGIIPNKNRNQNADFYLDVLKKVDTACQVVPKDVVLTYVSGKR